MAFLSYHPLKSIHCRMSSMGGWAPYTSSAGMFRSSMKKMKYLPSGGPNTPFRLSNKIICIRHNHEGGFSKRGIVQSSWENKVMKHPNTRPSLLKGVPAYIVYSGTDMYTPVTRVHSFQQTILLVSREEIMVLTATPNSRSLDKIQHGHTVHAISEVLVLARL